MKVEHNGAQYALTFRHKKDDDGGVRGTSCRIYRVASKELFLVTEGTACRHPGDPYNGPLGRFIAFRRAVCEIHDRPLRKALGDAYRSTVRIPKDGVREYA